MAFFFCLCGLVLTGLRALAAEMVSLCICIKAVLFDFFSVVAGLPSVEGAAMEEEFAADADGLDVMRSMSVVPADSWPDAMVRGRQRER